MTTFDGQVALVTGASRGIGRAIATALARARRARWSQRRAAPTPSRSSTRSSPPAAAPKRRRST